MLADEEKRVSHTLSLTAKERKYWQYLAVRGGFKTLSAFVRTCVAAAGTKVAGLDKEPMSYDRDRETPAGAGRSGANDDRQDTFESAKFELEWELL